MITLYEPDVALTDFALAIECAIFAIWLARTNQSAGALRPAFVAFFAAVGVASLLGGIAHGFLPDEQTLLHRIVWTGTLIAIGCASFASWAAGARLWLSDTGAARVTIFAGLLLAAYLVVVLFVSRAFVVAIAHYLPATVFLLVSFVVAYRRRRERFLVFGILGVALTFVAAGIQQGGVGLHPIYFNHNALYHVVQGCALALIFLAARGLSRDHASVQPA
jgi:predicted neutral ceramidase superfamily lipid hydrolase